MSRNAATMRTPLATPDRARDERAPERSLRPVAGVAGRRRPRLAYALIALGGAMAIGATQIALSLAITQDSFALAGLSTQQRELNLQTHVLQEELTGLSSPQLLAASAAGLGMVVAGSPSYLRLSDGAVFGTGTGAAGTSTVDPRGVGAVGNASIVVPPVEAVDPAATETGAVDPAAAVLPPTLTDGLPSPTTR